MVANNLVDSIISPLIPSQFPQFYIADGPTFLEFVQAYYQWLEQSGNSQYIGSITTESRNLPRYWDIDTTPSKFLKYFEDTFLANVPANMAVDPRFMIKHALDFYNSKGTEQSFEILFQMLYNQTATINTPGQYMFRLSNANWNVPKYIETTDSPFLNRLNGQLIQSSSGSTAVVESYNPKIVNGKVINIIYLSSLTGNFNFGDFIFCNTIPEMVGSQAPLIIGSLSTITVENGGINFNVGDELQIVGTGSGGIARVATTTNENGKVTFTLLDGGYGFSKNAAIVIDNTGTGGSGASFQIGDITDKQIISLDTDSIEGMYNTVMDLSTSGYEVEISNANGNFQNNELASGTALSLHLNIKTLFAPNGPILNGESLSSSILGISNVVIYFIDGQDLYLTGNSVNLNNANLISGTILVSNVSATTIQILYLSSVANVFANGIVIGSGSNSSFLSVHRADNADIGYYIPGMIVTGNVANVTATVTSCTRLTDWDYFPAISPSNLDDNMKASFTIVTKEIGRIAFIDHENPGDGYVFSPNVSMVEPLVYDLRIKDDYGGYWGYDAIVNSYAGSANGIATALTIVDSGFGWSPDESLVMYNANNNSTVFGKAVVSTTGMGTGSWTDTQSFLDDVMVLQDDYYYQVYSYEIVSENMLNIYEQYIKALAHPVGYALFGRYAVERQLLSPISLISSAISQDPIVVSYTADSDFFTSDGSVIDADQISAIPYGIDTLDGSVIITSDGDNAIFNAYRPIIVDYGSLITQDGDGITISGDNILLSSNININDVLLTSDQSAIVLGS